MNSQRKQFLPCLLDRLLDDEPRKQIEAWDKYHYDARKMRALIQNNITDILNVANMEDQLDVNIHNEVASSVVNFGISPVIGRHATSESWASVERKIRDAIIRFEPRLIADSVMIILNGDTESPARNGIIEFEIRALVYWIPQPFDLSLGARYDTETESAGLVIR
ncbi:GPW/gp25 family protein [Enterobacter ludwigii]|nr:GPW/gp25 family protein [Enterobacter ludwigii]